MEFELNFEKLPDYIFVQTQGEASVSGFDELLTAIVSSPKWVRGLKQLVDHRKLESENLTAEDIQAIKCIVEKHAQNLGNGCCAFVVSGPLEFGLVRMYDILGGENIHKNVAVFYKIDEAVEWLMD